jgi:hypothetical protein
MSFGYESRQVGGAELSVVKPSAACVNSEAAQGAYPAFTAALEPPSDLISAMIALSTGRIHAEDSRFFDYLIVVLEAHKQGTEPTLEWRGPDEPRFRSILRSFDVLRAGPSLTDAHLPRKPKASEALAASKLLVPSCF